MPRTTITVSAPLALVLFAGLAAAQVQRLPDAPPPTREDRTERVENFGRFMESYRRSGSPRLLFYTDAPGAEGQTLGARLEDLFRDPEVTVINSDAASFLGQSQIEALRRNDEFSAARMLGDSAKADVVVLVRLTPAPRGRSTGRYTATYTIADLRRGTTIGSYAWEMTPDEHTGEFDPYRMSEYAQAIGRRVARQYAEAYPADGSLGGMRRFTLRVVGDYEDDDLSMFRDAMDGAPGVRHGSVMLRAEDQSSAQQMATFELMYGSDVLDLRRAVRRATLDELGMEAEVIDSREGTIDLRLSPLELSARERMLAGGPTNARNRAERERLAQAYARAGSPTIAIMINKAAVESDAAVEPWAANQNPAQQGDEVNIIIGDRVDLARGGLGSGFFEQIIDRELRDRREERREDAVIDMRVFEDALAQRLLQVGLQPRDIAAAQSEALGDASLRDRAWTDRTLAYELGRRSGADIVVSGVGRLVRDRATGSPLRVVVTLRAYEVATGNIIGAASVQRGLSAGGESFNQSVDELATEAAGKIVAGLADAWARQAERPADPAPQPAAAPAQPAAAPAEQPAADPR